MNELDARIDKLSCEKCSINPIKRKTLTQYYVNVLNIVNVLCIMLCLGSIEF